MDGGTFRLGLLVLAAATIGFTGTYVLLTGPLAAGPEARAAGWPPNQDQASKSAQQNVQNLERMKGDLERRRQQSGAFPVAAGFVTPDQILGTKIEPTGFGGAAGRYLYLSPDGKDYKLIALGTGDCFQIKRTRPDLVDPARAYGSVDCHAYGFWSAALAQN